MKFSKTILLWLLLFCLLLFSCHKKQPPVIKVEHLFTLLPEAYTHIDFKNILVDEADFNVFKYRNYYNGGGVAIGDVNNDGLPDIYLVANQQSNKLFLNRGKMQFKDITDRANVAGSHKWSTGVSMVDINGDGWLDIYLCNSGNIEGDNRANELFLNQGNDRNGIPTFREAAAEYGIDDRGFSTHAAFFDYDRDGDLDLYVLNNAFRPISTFNLSKNLRHERDVSGGGDHLYRNDNGKFVDVSVAAGIYGSVIAFGLGVSVSDINNDGWLDIFIANDFFERDYLYLNNHDGTFTENLENMVRHCGLSSMGADVADLNNDGLMDIFSTDMLPEDDYRLKTTFTFDTFDFLEKEVEWGYYYQLSQNVLQLNHGFTPGCGMTFSDIAPLAGVLATDWSWGAIILDMNNDGWKDIFVSNGVFRDVTDQDYLDFLMRKENIRQILRGERINFPELIKKMPSTPLRNYVFRNNRNLTFSNMAATWGFDTLSFSNGTAYGDLDNDGDNDLVINNISGPAFIYRNEADSLTDHHYLQVKLVGEGKNTFAIGAKVTARWKDGKIRVLEQMPMRGFESSVDYVLTFGLGENTMVDTLIVDWPDGSRTVVSKIAADQLITLEQKDASPVTDDNGEQRKPASIFRDISDSFPLQYRHVENKFDDFKRELLLPHKLSTEGPRVARGDVNNDGREDLYFCGAKGSAGKLFIQTASGKFRSVSEAVFEKAKVSEDVDAAFFDADGDGDLDLYVVSGGNEFSTRSPALRDRLYINRGDGKFTRSVDALPKLFASGSCVAPADFDRDGDIDLFVGSRSIPWKYGLTPTSYLLENDGRGHFSLASKKFSSAIEKAGMVTDARWVDYDKDGDPDLALTGEWMPVTILQNTGDSLVNVTDQVGLGKTNGWWNRLIADDLNGDGYIDFVVGNLGENTKLKASPTEPVTLYVSDFDRNGLVESILCFYKQGKSYPLPLRDDLLKQLPRLRKNFPTHASYAGKQITDIFTPQQLQQAVVKEAYTFATTIFWGSKAGKFRAEPLPLPAQISPVYAILAADLDDDGAKDLLLAGNFYGATPQLGRFDAGYGTFLKGDGNGKFTPVPMRLSGLCLSGQVRDITMLSPHTGRKVLIFSKNNDVIQVYRVEK